MKLSIVIPCYNEGEKLTKNLETVHTYMRTLDISYEILVVDDGSSDRTKEHIERVLPSMENTYLIHYLPNQGKGHAVKTGFLAAKGDIVLFMDADLSTDLSAISSVIDVLTKDPACFGVIGSRASAESQVKKGLVRKIFSYGCHLMTLFITGVRNHDTQCGFKAFRAEIAKPIAEKQRMERFSFDVEYLYIARLNHWTIKEVPVIWNDDGDSRVHIIKDTLRFISDLFKIRANRKYYLPN